ncbi:MAG: hypothetical protein WBB23_00980 [Desulforhopalus sp.]
MLLLIGQSVSIRSAKNNSANNKLTNTCFLKSQVHGACIDLADKGAQFDCVLIAPLPPASGHPGLARQLAAITAKRLVCISSDNSQSCRQLPNITFDIIGQ